MNHISQGYARIADHKRLVLVYYLWNLLFSAFLLIPFALLIKEFFGDSMIGEMKGGLETVIAIADLLRHREGGFGAVLTFPLIGLGVNLFISMALAGGSLAVLKRGQGYCSRTFWGGVGSWFLPFLRQLLWSLPLLALIGAAVALVGVIGEQVWGEAMLGSTAYFLLWTKIALVVVGLFFYLRVLEYGRNLMVLGDLRNARLGFWRGLKLTFKHLGKTIGIGLAFSLPGVLLLWANLYLRTALEEPVTLFLITQVAILARYGLRIGIYAAQLSFTTSLQPPPACLAPELPETQTADPSAETHASGSASATTQDQATDPSGDMADEQSIDLDQLEGEDPHTRP